MNWTYEEVLADLQASRIDRPKPKPPAPVLTVAADHKLSVEGQRERVAREVKGLIEAEKNKQLAIETHRQRMQRQRDEGLYYRQLYEATALAEYYAKLRDSPARRGVYSPIARFEREMKDGV
jgi:hypothetical protein